MAAVSAVVQLVAVGDTEQEAAEAFAEVITSYFSALRRIDDYADDDASCERLLAGLKGQP